MRFACVFLIITVSVIFSSCKNNEIKPVVPDNTNDSINVGIQFNRYTPGVFYSTDTIQNEFKITNYSSKTIKSGSVFKTACKLNGLLFALDLIGSGPTEITLTSDLAPGNTFIYNPGYLLGSAMLDYFSSDTVKIDLLLYGVDDAVISEDFKSDPVPVNNKATLDFYSGGLKVE